ncbi:SAM-dependent methyltransferase [Streptomyces sp. L7]
MHRATRTAAEAGIRQFLDIGTGIPTEPNLHQVAQSVSPDAKVVYADNDPIVLRHAEALLHGAPEGSTEYVHADVRDPDTIPAAGRRDPRLHTAGRAVAWSRSPTTWATTPTATTCTA